MPRAPLSTISEFDLIRRLTRGGSASNSILLGVGDDAASIRIPRGHSLVSSVDTSVESVHFDRRWDLPRDIGWKAIAGALSDLAAMNAHPLASLVSVALPSKTPTRWIEEVYIGLHACARRFGAPIAGGDTVRSTTGVVISITVLGRAPHSRLVTRSGAKPGDTIWVSGTLGSCAAALDAVRRSPSKTSLRSPLFRKHKRPTPRFDVLEALRRRGIRPTAMIDISDGLVSDLGHIAHSSKVRCEIHTEPPAARGLRRYASKHGLPILPLLLHSGEEYELLFTLRGRDSRRASLLPGITQVGVVARGNGVYEFLGGKPKPIHPQGFRHFG